MFTAVLILIVILAILLILTVLIQNSKGGLSPTMGSASSQLIGVKRTTDLLEKITWGLTITIMVLSLASNLLLDKPGSESDVSSVNMERVQGGEQPAPAATSPASADTNK